MPKMRSFFLLLMLFAGLLISAVPTAAQDDSETVPVKKGETLLDVAIRLNKPAECIRQANDLTDLVSLPADVTELKIPKDCSTLMASASDSATMVDQTYTVQRGDRLNKIAEQFGTTVTCIAEANNIANPNLIFIGQQLLITASCQGGGGGGAPVSTSHSAGQGCQFDRNSGRSAPDGQYTVQSGDSLDFIACDFGVSLECLTDANPQLDNRSRLAVGDTLTIDLSCPAWTAWPGTGTADTP